MLGVPTPDELFNLARSHAPLTLVLDSGYIGHIDHQSSPWQPPDPSCRRVVFAEMQLTLNYSDGSKVNLKLGSTKIQITQAPTPLTGQEPSATVIDVPKELPQGETP
jgi:hypothetical protein